jgi:hypothetical protein
MRERRPLEDEINRLLQSIDQSQGNQEALLTPEDETGPLQTEPGATETIHVYVVREGADPPEAYTVDSTLAATKDEPLSSFAAGDPCCSLGAQHHRRAWPGLLAAGVGVLLPLASIAFQLLLARLPPTPTIMLVPFVRHLSTTATITIDPGAPAGAHIPGRLLPPLTLTQTTTVPATGRGHQDAQYARGAITFYNGLLTSQTVAAGTRLVGSDGVEVVTEQVAVIPAALATTPPTYGRVMVFAHATQTGPQGNIPVRDINEACCLPSVLAQNTVAFLGGQDERDYTVVTREDIDPGVTSLTTALIQSDHAAFTAQLRANETLATLPCTRSVTADHQAGAEATAVTVTVSEQCAAIAYDAAALQEQARQVLTRELGQRGESHYRLVGAVKATALRTRIIDQRREVAGITVHIEGTWMYQFNQQELERIRQLVAGKTSPQAVRILLGLPGIQRATIEAPGENRSLPKDSSHIQVHILTG